VQNLLFQPKELWALNDALSPEAASTGWDRAADTILLVGFKEIASSTKNAWREIERAKPFAKFKIFRLIPYFPDGLLQDIAPRVMFYGSFVSI
jgi:hypothetical protein